MFENVICEISASFSRGRWVKTIQQLIAWIWQIIAKAWLWLIFLISELITISFDLCFYVFFLRVVISVPSKPSDRFDLLPGCSSNYVNANFRFGIFGLIMIMLTSPQLLIFYQRYPEPWTRYYLGIVCSFVYSGITLSLFNQARWEQLPDPCSAQCH